MQSANEQHPDTMKLLAFPEYRYSAWQFAFIRIILGLYLLLHFSAQLPFSAEIYSSEGFLPDPKQNWTYGYFPNILYWFDSPTFVYFFLIALTAASFIFMCGWCRPYVAVFMWYGLACCFNRNNFTSNPSLSFLGWLLLAFAIAPKGEPLILRKRSLLAESSWELPPLLYWSAWLVLGMSYSASGLAKCASVSWMDGMASFYSATQAVGRQSWLSDLFLQSPPWFIHFSTWTTLAAELLFLPLCYTQTTRCIAWVSMTGVHITLFLLMRFPDLTLGVLIFHLFVFDPLWVPLSWRNRFSLSFQNQSA